VTSVKCNFPCPELVEGCRSFLNSRLFNAPVGCGVAALSGFVRASVPGRRRRRGRRRCRSRRAPRPRHDLRIVELARHPVEVNEVQAGLFGLSVNHSVAAGMEGAPRPEQAAAAAQKTKNAKRKTRNGAITVLRSSFCVSRLTFSVGRSAAFPFSYSACGGVRRASLPRTPRT